MNSFIVLVDKVYGESPLSNFFLTIAPYGTGKSNRYSMFADEFITNLDEFVDVTKENLPRIVVVFDEFADFMSQILE